MVDMAKAEEQLRGASDLMLELQQRLVEAQPHHAYPRPAVYPHGAPSRLPRENFPEEEDATYEEQTTTSVPPEKDMARGFVSAWAAEPGTISAGNPRLESRAGGIVAGLNPGGAPRARVVDYEWRGEQGGRGEVADVRGAVEAGGDGELRNQAFRLCDAGHTRGDVAATAASAETSLSPRPGSFLPLSIEVRTQEYLRCLSYL